jgi:hypothetical protein
MSLFERFAETKEEGFREEFIQPLLVKLGFLNISNKHGSQEFGKDYVFSEIDRFANYRHMVVQAKHEKSINQGRKVDDLLSQVRQAFTVPYHLPTMLHEERRVSAVYVFNTGAITENAQTQIRNGLADPAARCNVHFFDGAQLEMLANSNAEHFNETTRQRLNAFDVHLALNCDIVDEIRKSVADHTAVQIAWQMRPLLTMCFIDYMRAPVTSSRVDLALVIAAWQLASVIDVVRNKYYNADSIPRDSDSFLSDIASLHDMCIDVTKGMLQLRIQLKETLQELPAVTI